MTVAQRVVVCTTLLLLSILSVLAGIGDEFKPLYVLAGVLFGGGAFFLMFSRRGSSTSERPPRKRRNFFFWPRVDTASAAASATRPAFWVAIYCAAITALVAGLATAGIKLPLPLSLDAWAFVDSVLFAVIAIGLWRRSRLAAVAGLCLYLTERVWVIAKAGRDPSPIWTVLFVLAFIHGIRGAYALHRLNRSSGEQEEARANKLAA